MLQLTVKKLMLAKAISKPHSFLLKQGMNSTTVSKLLKSNCKSLKVEHIELLCWHLSCTPSELFEWIPDKKYVDQPGHPLQQIRAVKQETELPKLLKRLSRKQLEDLSRQAVAMLIANEGGKFE
jgi:DNA-binding Xre family transcriptional regulator